LAQPIAIGAAVERTQFRAEFQRLFTAHCYGSQAGVHSVSMNVIPLILMVELGVFVFYLLRVSERYRAGAIRALAIHSGMHYLGNALPKSLRLEGTPFCCASKVWNVVDGEPRGTRIMAFDCQVGAGKHSWRRTVIAVESDDNILGYLPVPPDMTINRSGGWQILYRPKAPFNIRIAGLTPVEELEANIKAFVTGSAKSP
jgi:hypothetical protein